jgi:hypothetical protein
MAGKSINLTGQRFGRLTVLRFHKIDNRRTMWWCRCACGQHKSADAHSLKRGSTKSCGCFHRDSIRARATIHGRSGSREYSAWENAKARCFNPHCKDFKHYGGRGITMNRAWADDFSQFYRDLGACPPKLTLERIDNEGNYEKGNCRWATMADQRVNYRDNRFLTFRGERLTIAHWADRLGLGRDMIYWRLNHGWTVEKALTTPSQRKA